MFERERERERAVVGVECLVLSGVKWNVGEQVKLCYFDVAYKMVLNGYRSVPTIDRPPSV